MNVVALTPTLATNAAFVVVFAVFVVALLVLAVVATTWAIRHDRAGRQAWLQRRRQAAEGDPPRPQSPPRPPYPS
jgi:hypothetical protein